MRMNCIQASFLGVFLCFVALRITSAVIIKPGVCPPERFYNSTLFPPPSCESDGECPGDKKCCLDNNARFCKTPAKERGKSCLKTPPKKFPSMKRCNDECSSDSECAPGSKCCFKICGNKCLPKRVKKGSCPKVPVMNCLIAERPLCINDAGCPGQEKCCPSGCSSKCQAVVKG
ncbi:hypothetical protein GDO81_013138 [Engystomops pustulosus]|uniref:WAP domain-containing protein n=1 Tax=Engystomops pustulosus TaxID=76066 RepID=A0AAV7AX89_ENGPU|nr:hypothetical protein GDO81_013138 [Engystomops pustulosus]